MIPGIGAAVIDWLSYGHALRTEKGARPTSRPLLVTTIVPVQKLKSPGRGVDCVFAGQTTRGSTWECQRCSSSAQSARSSRRST